METTFKSGFKNPITISDAIAYIEKRYFLLPAIQRRFVWSSSQIEVLFDSIMRDYPINSFMFWHVTDDTIKTDYKFYEFLKEYKEFFAEENPYFNTNGVSDFLAVIDGQQRLTSLYLGLKGTYAYRMPRKWLKNDEECLPTRKLYINLAKQLPVGNDRNMIYDFKFLSENEYKRLNETEELFLLGDIYKYKDDEQLDEFLDTKKWKVDEEATKKFAKSTLRKLRKIIFDERLISYYQEENPDIDTVLDIFIRTNSGGEPLSFSNLLMSITTANWQRDARKEFENLIKNIFNEYNFRISSDLILKCCLVLFGGDIKFQVANFNKTKIQQFDQNWDRIKKCFETTFKLLNKWGFNDSNLRAKNAIIPIVYYIYHHNFDTTILKDTYLIESKSLIRKWLCISLLKGVFGGHSDNVLTKIRSVLDANKNENDFPFDAIKKEFATDDAKSLSLSDEVIEDILKTQKDASNAYIILSLIYSHLKYDTISYHKDHLHPASKFEKLKESDFVDIAKYKFYTNKENWNSILNLQLLSALRNESKNDEDLVDWVKRENIDRKEHIIPEGDDILRFDKFEEFIKKRKELLIERIKQIIGI